MAAFIKFYVLAICLTLSIEGHSQNRPKTPPTDNDIARRILKSAFTDTFNVIQPNRIILKDKYKVMLFAEQILFDIYGKSTIISERPYKIYFINSYWVMWGQGPGGDGGTFEIVIDSRNCRIVRISHGA